MTVDLSQLERQAWRPKTTAAWHEEFTYRAAILEYDGGFSRADAEMMALKIVGPISRSETRKNRSERG